MISIHLSDFVTDVIVFSLCFWFVLKGIESACRVWVFLKTKQAIDREKKE